MRLVAALPHYPWPPLGGARTRSWHLFSALAHRHDVHLLALQSPDEPAGDLSGSNPFASIRVEPVPTSNPPRWSGAWAGLRVRSLQHSAPAFYQPRAAAILRGIVGSVKPDAVIFGMSWMLPYAADVPGIPAIADEHNYDPLIAARTAQTKTGLERLKWDVFTWMGARAERRDLARMRAVAACSEQDAAIFRREAPHAEVAVVPNGVDCASFSVTPPGDDVVMTASWSYTPNAAAADRLVERIWPLVRRDVPTASLRLVGMKGEHVLAHLAGRPGVTIVGTVPDMRPELARARVAVAPIDVGGGTRIKILEAFAAGRAVVSTSLGAEGIEARDGDAIVLRDDDAGFAAAIVELLRDPARAAAIGARARALAEAQYDWSRSATLFEDLVRRAAG